jgi:hypothetical protein
MCANLIQLVKTTMIKTGRKYGYRGSGVLYCEIASKLAMYMLVSDGDLDRAYIYVSFVWLRVSPERTVSGDAGASAQQLDWRRRHWSMHASC